MDFLKWCLVGIVLTMGSLALAAASPDGSEWRVEITPEGVQIPHYIDRLRFEKGRLTSVIFERKGFTAVPYTKTDEAEGEVVWSAAQKSGTDGTLDWQGEFKAATMTGTLVWRQPDGKVIKHTLVGTPAVDEATAQEEGAKDASSASSAPSKKSGWGCTLTRS